MRLSASGSRSMAVLFGLSENKKYYSSACPVFAFLGRRTGAVLPEAESSADRLVTDDVGLSGSGLCRLLGSV